MKDNVLYECKRIDDFYVVVITDVYSLTMKAYRENPALVLERLYCDQVT